MPPRRSKGGRRTAKRQALEEKPSATGEEEEEEEEEETGSATEEDKAAEAEREFSATGSSSNGDADEASAATAAAAAPATEATTANGTAAETADVAAGAGAGAAAAAASSAGGGGGAAGPGKSKSKSKAKSKGKASGGGGSSTAASAAAAAAAATEPPKDPDEHPLDVSAVIVVRWQDDSERFADVIHREEFKDPALGEDAPSQWNYYVHYHDFNRRMDEWITVDRIVRYPSKAQEELQSLRAAEELAGGGHNGHGNALKRKHDDPSGPSTVADLEHDEHEGLDPSSLHEHEEVTKIKNIRRVQLGRYIMDTWYFSPFPAEYFPGGFTECLFFCEFTMRFFRFKEELIRYQSRPDLPRFPPGYEVYRDDKVAMFEIDGAEQRIYCQNLCYLAKLFLDHKTLYYDVDPFLFYVMCEIDDRGYHPVGYFSKEKYSEPGYNLACILVFPAHQRKGYGRFLIAFSYELSKAEQKVGSPEKPLSDLGRVSYQSYWNTALLTTIKRLNAEAVSIMDLVALTSIVPEDVISTLQTLGLLRYDNGMHCIYAPSDLVDELLLKYPPRGLQVDPSKLHWAPFTSAEAKKDKWHLRSKLKQADAETEAA